MKKNGQNMQYTVQKKTSNLTVEILDLTRLKKNHS